MLELKEAGWTAKARLDFNLGMLWYGDWVEAKKSEQVWVKHTDEHKGMSPRPKYESMNQILAEYDDTMGMTKFAQQAVIPAIDMDAVIEAAYGDDIQF